MKFQFGIRTKIRTAYRHFISKPNKDALFIFGFQKSGTSAIAGLLAEKTGKSVSVAAAGASQTASTSEAVAAAAASSEVTVLKETVESADGKMVQEVHIHVEQAAIATSEATSKQVQVQGQAQKQTQKQAQVQVQKQKQQVKPKVDADGYEVLLDDLNNTD